jgi:hypothetical protein
MVSTTTKAPKRAAVRPTAAWVAGEVEERTRHEPRASPQHHLGFEVARVHGLGVGEDRRVRTKLARGRYRADPETFEKRRANLDDVGYPSHLRNDAEVFRLVDRNLQQHGAISPDDGSAPPP